MDRGASLDQAAPVVAVRRLAVVLSLLAGCVAPPPQVERPAVRSVGPSLPAEVAFPARRLPVARGFDGQMKPARADVVSRDFFVVGEDYRLDFGHYAYLVFRDRPAPDTRAAMLEAVRAFFCEAENSTGPSLELVAPARAVVLFAPLDARVGRAAFVERPDPSRFVQAGYDFVLSRLWWNELHARRAGQPLPPVLVAAAPLPLFDQTRHPANLAAPPAAEIEVIDLSGDPAQVRDSVRRFRNALVLPETALDERGGTLLAIRRVISDLADLVGPLGGSDLLRPAPRDPEVCRL